MDPFDWRGFSLLAFQEGKDGGEGAAPVEGQPAKDGEAGEAAPPAGNISSILFPIMLMVFAFYFILWRPESRRNRDRQQLLQNLKKGDEVLTSGGIVGVVSNVKDNSVMLKVDESRGTTIEFHKTSILQVLKQRSGDGAPSENA